MMGTGLGLARRLANKYGPIDYRGAATKIQKAFRKYKKRKATYKKKFSSNKRLKTGSFPAVRIGRLMGVHGRKGKKPKPITGVRRKFDKSLLSTQSMVNYVGFQMFGSSWDILNTYCMHLVKDMMKRAGAAIDSWQGGVESTTSDFRLWRIKMVFQNDPNTGTVDRVEEEIIPTGNKSAEEIATLIAVAITNQYGNGYYPSSYRLIEQDGTVDGKHFYRHDTWGEDMVHFAATSYANVQNVTPTDDGGTNINDVNANPLVGKVYDFKHPYIKFDEEYLREVGSIVDFDELQKLQDMAYTQDLVETNYLRKDALNYAEALPVAFKKPPRGAAVFNNLDGAKGISLPPGGYQVVKRSITVKCSARRFIAGVFNTFQASPVPLTKPLIRPIVNKVMLMAFEPSVRSQSNESVKVIVNRRISHDLKIVRKKPSNLPVHNTVNDVVTI